MDEIAEIDTEVRRLRERIFELNQRRIEIKKRTKRARECGPASPETLSIPVASLRFSPRIHNVFKNYNVHTLGDLVQYSERELIYGYYDGRDFHSFANLGAKSVLEIKVVLLTFGLKLKGDK
jgi:DNA-directed RNA polymerase alpha subunit